MSAELNSQLRVVWPSTRCRESINPSISRSLSRSRRFPNHSTLVYPASKHWNPQGRPRSSSHTSERPCLSGASTSASSSRKTMWRRSGNSLRAASTFCSWWGVFDDNHVRADAAHNGGAPDTRRGFIRDNRHAQQSLAQHVAQPKTKRDAVLAHRKRGVAPLFMRTAPVA